MLSICKKIVFAAALVAGLAAGTASAADFCGAACPPAVNACVPAPVVAPVACDPCGDAGFRSSSVAGYSVSRYSGVTYEDSASNAIYLIPTTGGLLQTRGYRPPTNEVDSYYSSRYQTHWF